MGEGFEKVVEELERDLVGGISPTVVDHALNPRNVGSMEDADGFAQFTGPCGDTMEIWIKVRDGEIVRASFWTDGCGTTVASGSMVTELVKGKMVLDAMEITKEDVLSALGGLPEESEHCALLAATTLKLAIADYLRRKGSL
ncbi:MAG: iron-sulfur cluster assembly scaffold protein [Deltaproteobacteria bacterium]|nr:MAG: iron-sulfur cluster assembly scaffold protein [Deltaproteobacteria bacterium]